MSDHKCLIFSLTTNENLRGPGYWKFNTSLLENKNFIGEMNILLKQFAFDKEKPIDSWDILKRRIKTFCINFSKKLSKSYKSKISSIQKEINIIENLPYENINMNRKRELETELSELINKKAKGAQIRSRANWIENGEKNTAYFLSLEKKRQLSNVIKSLRNGNDYISDEDQILQSLCEFYEKLYKSCNTNNSTVDEYLDNLNLEYILNDKDRIELDKFPTLSECTEAILSMKKISPRDLMDYHQNFTKHFGKA